MSDLHISVLVLQEVGAHAVEDARLSHRKCTGMFSGFYAASGSFHADEFHLFLINEFGKHADGVGAAAHAGDHTVRQPSFFFEYLLFCLHADDALELFDHLRVRVRSHGGTDDIKSILRIFCPGTDRLVSGILEGAASGLHTFHLRAEHFHAEYIERLSCHIFLSHVHRTFHPEKCGSGGGRHAVLTGSGLRNDFLLSHALCQKDLPDHVVDFVSAGVIQVLPLEIDLRPVFLRQFFCQIKGRFSSHIIFQIIFIFPDKRRVADCLPVSALQFL